MSPSGIDIIAHIKFIGLVALVLLGWELRASSITVLCVQAVMILSPLLFMPSLHSHSNSKNFYITCPLSFLY